MSIRRSFPVARALTDLALDYACHARIPGQHETYSVMLDDERSELRIVLPAAVHDALCDSESVVEEDERRNIIVCGKCRTPHENERR